VETVSPEALESTRTLNARNRAELLRAIDRVTQARAAACRGVHPSTISRDLAVLQEHIDLLGQFGLQITPTDSMVVDPSELEALESMAYKYLETRRQQRAKGSQS
jgi:hypothetical protein